MSRPKLLICELWGIGDLVLSTTLIRMALPQYEVHLLAKASSQLLLGPSYPELRFHPFTAPWTSHRGKYRLQRWPWNAIASTLAGLRREKFAAAVSVRPDPRDHALMLLAGARRRLGYPVKGSGALLTDRLPQEHSKQHRVESWRELGQHLGIEAAQAADPQITSDRYRTERIENHFAAIAAKPVVCLHAGAGSPLRRWPAEYFAQIIGQLRKRFAFHLLLIPDVDGYGMELAHLADSSLASLTLQELVDVCSRVDLLFCNDSGPMHLTAALDRPVIAFFGPGNPAWFAPWGRQHRMVIRDICPYRPCFDYCRFPKPYCLTKLLPNIVWPEIERHVQHLVDSGMFSAAPV